MTFSVGSLVKARGREWVVLPESEKDFLVLRPLGGTEDEIAGIHTDLEAVETAHFDLPDPSLVGDYRSARLLRDAVRLGFRSSAGPFRSFGRLGCEPRPYQLVPLLVALKLDPIRILIADDVGIGKTIEACLIARELLDRGEVARLAVLCPPALAEQWQSELREKFHIEAELVLSSTAARLERGLSLGQSLFDVYPFVVVSTDYIKSDVRRDEFLRTCPELVIVDEAHTCAFGHKGRGGRQQRHELVSGLATDEDRHLILVTATPHSGKEEAFRSLLTFLTPDFADLPDELSGPDNVQHRRHLAQHFVQRRRADIRHYLDADTKFPKRQDAEDTYNLSDEYKHLFNRVLHYARETVLDPSGEHYRQRVRWWSALALLRSLASSPAAAAATLRTRASTTDAETTKDVDEIGRRAVLDLLEDEAAEGTDVVPGGDIGELAMDENANRRRLLDMAREAESLIGDQDTKLIKAIDIVKKFLKDGYHPIVFCRFIPTAEYVAEEFRKRLPGGIEVAAITGTLPPSERMARVEQLGNAKKRILVCTDCLSEGINLQDYFDAVMHYDLSWNPTRHEQREGRVDRFGQPKDLVRVMTYYGVDNQIDGIVLDVLLRKHRTIRNSLGISVPVPVDAEQVIEAIFEGLLLRETADATAKYLPGFEEYIKPKKDELYREWEAAEAREKRSRTMFAQETIMPEEVANELHAAQDAIGLGVDVSRFFNDALRAHKGVVQSKNGAWSYQIQEVPQALREMMGAEEAFDAKFQLPVQTGQIHLMRTHPMVEGLASYLMDTALDPLLESAARRCGVIRTNIVNRRTTLLLVRFRYHIRTDGGSDDHALLAEDIQAYAFAGSPEKAEWLGTTDAEELMMSEPEANIAREQASGFIHKVIDGYAELAPQLEAFAQERGALLLDAHMRVRQAARMRGRRPRVEPHLPPDVLGIYVFLPAAKSSD